MWRIVAVFALAVLTVGGVGAEPLESPRMSRAKDYIADEQWTRAIEELKAAAADRKESSRDEALFWLAHSQNQAGDPGAALETVRRLEREHAKSRWVRPARSLRLEIAQRLRRWDVLWYTAQPPPPPAPLAPEADPPTPAPHAPPTPPPPRAGTRVFRPVRGKPVPPTPVPAPPATRATPPSPAPTMVAPAAPAAPPSPPTPRPGVIWFPDEHYHPDTDLRIQALGSLIRTDAETVIPILKGIALESDNTGQARRALFVLAHSGRPEARTTVVDVAKTGPELVRIAAVRELGRIRGVEISKDLLQVYSTGNDRVKQQVVTSLGERAETTALARIIQSETNRRLRDVAIVTLGSAGGREPLRALYDRASAETKRPIIIGLFNARAEEELIRIAERERDPALRREVLARLRLLGTPKAKAFLERQQR
jgi:HEAT repeat protein